MATTRCVSLLFFFVSLTTLPTVAFYVNQSPEPCQTGEACLYSFSRSYVNNLLFCCPNGAGSSISSFNNVIHCQCGSGTFVSDDNVSTIFVNGVQLNTTEAQPYIDEMNRIHRQNMEQFNRNMQQFHWNMQQSQANLQANLAAMRARLNNMAQNLARRFQWWY